MSDNYCEFVLKTLDCVECGNPTPFLGTCKDTAFCMECRKKYLDAGNGDYNGRMALVRMAQDNPTWDIEAPDLDIKTGRYR